MAATPPRPSSPVSSLRHVAIPKPIHNLQISPNLEALLEHDELTRRNSGSPTSLYHSTSQLSPSGFAVSLPPPPRNVQGSRKTPQRDQDAVSITRTRELPRKRSANVRSDFWSDALSAPVTDAQSNSSASSRSVTPNPYINPAPVLRPIDMPGKTDVGFADKAVTPKANEKHLPNEPKASISQSASFARPRSSQSEVLNRSSTALHKMEKILWMGRDSLTLFSGAGSLRRHESDRRSDRAEHVDPLTNPTAAQGKPTVATRGQLPERVHPWANVDKRIRQVPVVPNQNVSREASRFGDSDTATVLSSRSAYLPAPEQGSSFELNQNSPTRPSIYCEPTDPYSDKSFIRKYATTSLPRLSLPSISMPFNSPPRLQPVDSNAGHDYLSFIDFLSPSIADGLNSPNFQGNSNQPSTSRRRPQSLALDSYVASHHNLSSTSLASMKFAPPSPTSGVADTASPTYPHSDDSSSTPALSAMIFAPPSPSASHLAPPHLQPVSLPPSPNSPLEFAPPPSPRPELLRRPALPTFPEISERDRKYMSGKRSVSASPHPIHHSRYPLPPTTNLLDANERADRIRRSRKLARVFGRDPGLDAGESRLHKKLPPLPLAALLGSGKPKQHRHAMSVSVSVKSPGLKTEPTTPWQTDGLWSPGGRRHSIPLTPSSFKFFVDDEPGNVPTDDPQIPQDGKHSRRTEPSSPTSFIDLSDDEVHDGDITLLDVPYHPRRLHQSCSTPSLVESLDPEAQAELDRRRRRDKLARLHRFLGSRVPMEAVTGGPVGPPLPPVAPLLLPEENHHDNRPRRSRPAVDTSQPEFDRGKEELGGKEKALNVRRAQKMEKVFGTLPPQMLYHTRSSVPQSQPTSPSRHNPFVLSLDFLPTPRNLNQSAYKGKKTRRPGPSDSTMHLLPCQDDNTTDSPISFVHSFANSFADSFSGYQDALPQSPVYLNYQHSLNSLVDIIDRDDRQSLVDLHRFIHGDVEESAPEDEITLNPRRMSNGSSLKSERRRSLPSRASMTSVSSEVSETTPKMSQFQLHRRRAAKLANFFGVDYRELIHEILESIEKGVDEDRKRGILQPQEVEVLLHRVRSLRTLEDQFS